MPLHATRSILAFCGLVCAFHPEQCTLAEFCAYIVRDVISHIELAAEARVKKPALNADAGTIDDTQLDLDKMQTEAEKHAIDLVDVGGTLDEEEEDLGEEVGPDDISLHPLQDHRAALDLAMHQRTLDEIHLKKRKSKTDKELLLLDDSYGDMLRAQSFAFAAVQADSLLGMHFKDDFAGRLALQKQSIALAKKQLNAGDVTIDDSGDAWMPNSGYKQDEEERDVEVVPLPLALKGPGAVAWKLLQDASCTEDQIDAVALLALSLQKRFDARPDKKTLLCPVATPDNNHRAVWLGGGGVGKTHTLIKVVEPLSLTFFGPNGYLPTAQSNHAAQNLGPQETWRRMPAKIWCGDFFQLPPVPASSSLLAPLKGQTYEHQQGHKIVADMQYVVDFVEMKRFDDNLLVEVLQAMRTPGGKAISEEAWQAIEKTEIGSQGSDASQLTATDPRLRAARGWYDRDLCQANDAPGTGSLRSPEGIPAGFLRSRLNLKIYLRNWSQIWIPVRFGEHL